MSTSIPKTSGIYKITCIPTGKIYIGSTNNLFRRWITHRRDLRGNYHRNSYLQHAWNKYGETVFLFEVIEFCSIENLIPREQYWLDTLNPFGESGFNIAIKVDSGMRGRKASSETRAKLSIAHKGKKFSAERNAKISAAKLGQKRSPETCAKIGAASKGRKFSVERNDKIRQAHAKEWVVIDPFGNRSIIKSLTRFCKENQLDMPTMLRVAKGRSKHHKGWKCEYIKR